MRRPKGGPTHRSICQLRREGNLLTPSTARRGARSPLPGPPQPRGGSENPDAATSSARDRVVKQAGTMTAPAGLTPPPPLAEMRGDSSPAPARPPVRARAAGRSRGIRSGRGRRGYGKVTGRRRPRPEAATSALPLASQSAQYLLSSSLSSLDRMSWCCSFSF